MLKKKLRAVRNHVRSNRGKYAAGATLAACIALQLRNAKELNRFLAEHDLLDKYYADPDEN